MMLVPNLSQREKRILFICVCVIAASVVYSFVLEPLAKRWIELNSEIAIMKLKLRKNTEILKRRKEIVEQYKNISSTVSVEKGSDEENIALLLSEVERLASTANVRITDIKPRPIRESVDYKRYTVEVESEGNISQLTKFIYEIQRSSQLLKIDKLSLNMKVTTGNLLKANFIITKILP